MRRIAGAFVILSIAVVGWAQPKLSVSTTHALIGDHIDLILDIPVNSENQWLNQDVVPGDTVEAIEILGSLPIQQIGDNALRQQWKIAVFDTGTVRIPPVPVVLRRNGSVDTLYTLGIPLLIEGVVDSLGMAPIKPLYYEPARFSDYLPYILGVVAVIALILGAIWWSRRPKREDKVVEIRDPDPPDVVAFARLDDLEAKKLWQKGLITEYHDELNHIVRQYLEGRYNIRALESTSEEIVHQLRKLSLGEDMVRQTREMLHLEDLIKFAKARPPEEIHAGHLEFVRDFVRQTKPSFMKTEEDA